MLHKNSRMYPQVGDIGLIKEYFTEKERLGKLCLSMHRWGCKQQA